MTDTEKNNDKATSVDESGAGNKPKSSGSIDTSTSQAAGANSGSRKSQRKLHRSSKTESTVVKRRTNPLFALLVLLNLLISLGFAAAGYWAWQQWQDWQTVQQQQQTQLHSALENDVQQKLTDLQKASLAEVARTIKALQSTEQQISADMSALRNEVQEQLAGAEQDLDMAEVEYLVRMASRKLNVEKNTRAALILLQEADAMLVQKDDQNLSPLRTRIASDMVLIRELQLSHSDDRALQLGAMLTRAKVLAFPTPQEHFAEPAKETSSDSADWWQNLQVLWQNLVDDFFKIDEIDTPVTPLMNTQQQELTRVALSYHLLAMRHALLQGNESLFRQALQQAQTTLHKFEQSQAALRLLKQDLATMAQQPFPEPIEVVFASLDYFSSAKNRGL